MVLDTLFSQHPELKGRIIPIEFHINTPMGGDEQPIEPMYQQIKVLSEEFTGAPGSNSFMHSASLSYSFNRSLPGYTPMPEFVKSYSESAEEFITKSNLDESASVEVSIEREYDTDNKTVSGKIKMTFEQSVPDGDYRVGLYIVEHGVTGPSPNYRQYSDLAFPDSYDDNYVFPDVLRDEVIAGSIWGGNFTSGSAILIDQEYVKEFSYTLPDLYYDISPKAENINLVAFVCRYDAPAAGEDPAGEILNATEIEMIPKDTPNSNKFSPVLASENVINVKRNNGDILTMNYAIGNSVSNYNLQIFDGHGRQIVEKEIKGAGTLSFKNLPKGFLFANIKGHGVNISKKIINN